MKHAQAPSSNHQTIKLSAGRHDSPQHGACVMELASMLAGESFSDHPEGVCPVLGAFLRTFNDHVDLEAHGRDLVKIAPLVVGTAAGPDVRRRRLTHCRKRMAELRREEARRPRWPWRFSYVSVAAACGKAFAVSERHPQAMAFVCELVAMGQPEPHDTAPDVASASADVDAVASGQG